ncbi:MAG: site-specific DNA-methyltransferase [Acidobacteriota bacterium]
MTKRNTPKKLSVRKSVETLMHDEASRKNIPTAEYQSVLQKEEQRPIRVVLPRGAAALEEEKAQRTRDLDPQMVWRGKDEQDWSDLVVQAPPIYIQEKVHPKVLIDDLLRQSKANKNSKDNGEPQFDLFADFNGLPSDDAKTEFYRHDANWANRIILGDSLQVMASLAEREALRGKVQCIYIDPPYGIKFNSNFQWSTTSRDVKDGNVSHITREPEQVKAFRDTWRDGVHTYLTYLRDRLTAARDLLSRSGSVFVQIGSENVHRVRALLDEVFGEANFVNLITFQKTSSSTSDFLGGVADYLVWYCKDKEALKFRNPYYSKELGAGSFEAYNKARFPDGLIKPLASLSTQQRAEADVIRIDNITSQSMGRDKGEGAASWFPVKIEGRDILPSNKVRWKTNEQGMRRLQRAGRLHASKNSLGYIRRLLDFSAASFHHIWTDTVISGSALDKNYVVETLPLVVQRCVLMTTDPGDLVLDPTCGSGTTAYVAEQWGRRWITIDTSRVALALARARIMGARYSYYLLGDSPEGQAKESQVTLGVPSSQPTHGDIRHGFVYRRVPHVTLKSIANNAEIDVIWEKFQARLESLREQLNAAVKASWEEWEIPREDDNTWTEKAKKPHAEWWKQRIARQNEIDDSIADKAEFEYLYDKPYEDKKKVRVAGPFTVESLSPHRVLGVDENDELIDSIGESKNGDERDFVQKILENLKTAGVQQAHKEDKINFTSLIPWPGYLICAEGRYHEGGPDVGTDKRAAVFIGPEFGTVARPDLVSAAREAGDAGFDVLITCAFNYDAHSTEFSKLGRIPVLKARMNADLHMSDELKNTGKGNLFVIFGEPDIAILEAEGGQIQVKVNGVDVFHPNTGEVRSDGAEGIACWFIDTDYNEESFFVRHAYFLGANDPYKSLKTTLKAEINEEAWATLNSDTSRPFDKPESGRIAVKVINHLGDEVMKVFRV